MDILSTAPGALQYEEQPVGLDLPQTDQGPAGHQEQVARDSLDRGQLCRQLRKPASPWDTHSSLHWGAKR